MEYFFFGAEYVVIFFCSQIDEVEPCVVLGGKEESKKGKKGKKVCYTFLLINQHRIIWLPLSIWIFWLLNCDKIIKSHVLFCLYGLCCVKTKFCWPSIYIYFGDLWIL